MKRRDAALGALALALPAARLAAADTRVGTDPAAVVGAWRGRGRWLDREFQARVGSFDFELLVHPDLSCEGRAGDAPLARSAPERGRQPLVFHFALPQPVNPRAPAQRLHLVLLLTGIVDDELDVDFHLKARRGFDPGMQVGNLRARRRP